MQDQFTEEFADNRIELKNFDPRSAHSQQQVLHTHAAGRTSFGERRLLLFKIALLYRDPYDNLAIILAQQNQSNLRGYFQHGHSLHRWVVSGHCSQKCAVYLQGKKTANIVRVQQQRQPTDSSGRILLCETGRWRDYGVQLRGTG